MQIAHYEMTIKETVGNGLTETVVSREMGGSYTDVDVLRHFAQELNNLADQFEGAE